MKRFLCRILGHRFAPYWLEREVGVMCERCKQKQPLVTKSEVTK